MLLRHLADAIVGLVFHTMLSKQLLFSYNVLSLRQEGRLCTISRLYRGALVGGLQGTRMRQFDSNKPEQRKISKHHYGITFGYSKASNKTAGVTILISTFYFDLSRHLKLVDFPRHNLRL